MPKELKVPPSRTQFPKYSYATDKQKEGVAQNVASVVEWPSHALIEPKIAIGKANDRGCKRQKCWTQSVGRLVEPAATF
jgi:hypothetical protein